MVFVEEHISEPVENGGGVSTRHKNPGPGAYTTVSVGESLERGDKEGGIMNGFVLDFLHVHFRFSLIFLLLCITKNFKISMICINMTCINKIDTSIVTCFPKEDYFE